MLRAAFRPLCRAAPLAPTQLAVRHFAAAAAVRKPKVEDGTLEGRYATALFMATSNNLDKVYQDLCGLRSMMDESKEFRTVIETPGIDPATKVEALQAVCQKSGADGAVMNFMKVLIENKRLAKLYKTIDLFETFYRAEKGLVLCKVTSAETLSETQKAQVKKAMEQRAEKGSTLIMEYNTNPTLMGGLVVKMGEAILDNSVASRLERMQNQLLAPLA